VCWKLNIIYSTIYYPSVHKGDQSVISTQLVFTVSYNHRARFRITSFLFLFNLDPKMFFPHHALLSKHGNLALIWLCLATISTMKSSFSFRFSFVHKCTINGIATRQVGEWDSGTWYWSCLELVIGGTGIFPGSRLIFLIFNPGPKKFKKWHL
jgi:hypothetical protein